MKKLLTIAITLVLFISAHSQEQMNLKWGPFQNEAKDHELMFHIGIWPEDSTSEMFITNKQVEIYDQHMHLTKKISLSSLVGNKELQTVIRKNEKVFLVLKDGKDVVWTTFKKKQLEVSDINSAFELNSKKPLKTKFSRDSSCILFYTLPDAKKKEMNLFICTYNGKKKWEATAVVNYDPLMIYEPFLAGCSEVLYMDKKDNKICISRISEKASGATLCSISPVNEKFSGAKACNTEHGWEVVLTYNKDNVNYSSLEFIQYVSVSYAGKIIRNNTVTLEKSIDGAQPVDLLNLGNSMILVTEQFNTKTNNTNNQISYGSLNVININKSEGTVNWNTEIFKNHYSVVTPDIIASPETDRYKELHAHITLNYNGFIYFIYNDNCNNCKLNGTLSRSHAAINKSCVNMVRVNKRTGKLDQYVYPSFNGEKYSLSINNTAKANKNSIYLFAKNTQFRLGKLILPEK